MVIGGVGLRGILEFQARLAYNPSCTTPLLYQEGSCTARKQSQHKFKGMLLVLHKYLSILMRGCVAKRETKGLKIQKFVVRQAAIRATIAAAGDSLSHIAGSLGRAVLGISRRCTPISKHGIALLNS